MEQFYRGSGTWEVDASVNAMQARSPAFTTWLSANPAGSIVYLAVANANIES